MVSSKQAAVTVLIGLMFKGKVPPVIWDEPRMSKIQEGEWEERKEGLLKIPFRRRTLYRTIEFLTPPHYLVRMQLQATQHESEGRVSTPLWVVREVLLCSPNPKSKATPETLDKHIGQQCWFGGRASIAHLVEAAKSVFQPEDEDSPA